MVGGYCSFIQHLGYPGYKGHAVKIIFHINEAVCDNCYPQRLGGSQVTV